MVTYEAMALSVGGQWFRSWLSDWIIGVVTYEAMTPKVVQVVRVDIAVVTYESMTPSVGGQWFRLSEYR